MDNFLIAQLHHIGIGKVYLGPYTGKGPISTGKAARRLSTCFNRFSLLVPCLLTLVLVSIVSLILRLLVGLLFESSISMYSCH